MPFFLGVAFAIGLDVSNTRVALLEGYLSAAPFCGCIALMWMDGWHIAEWYIGLESNYEEDSDPDTQWWQKLRRVLPWRPVPGRDFITIPMSGAIFILPVHLLLCLAIVGNHLYGIARRLERMVTVGRPPGEDMVLRNLEGVSDQLND
jgi:hypothetical protein